MRIPLVFLFAFGGAFSLFADVNFDIVQSERAIPAPLNQKVPWTDRGVFSISPSVYAPVLDSATRGTMHVHIKGHKMLVSGTSVSRIYDLDAGSVTTIYDDTRTYKVESVGVKPRRVDGAGISVRKTDKTFALYGQDASEYEIMHKNKAAARLLCWVADRAPSSELEEFAKTWLARTGLPFSPAVLTLPQSSFAYGALAAAQSSMPGYLLGFIADARNRDRLPFAEGSPASYQAYYEGPAAVRTRPQASGSPALAYDPFVREYPSDFLLQVNLRNVSSAEFDPSGFAIPPGFRLK